MILTLLLLLGTPPQASEVTAQPKEAPKVKKICRRSVATSSRLDVTRICRTRAEWDQSDAEAGRNTQRSIDIGRAGSAG